MYASAAQSHGGGGYVAGVQHIIDPTTGNLVATTDKIGVSASGIVDQTTGAGLNLGSDAVANPTLGSGSVASVNATSVIGQVLNPAKGGVNSQIGNGSPQSMPTGIILIGGAVLLIVVIAVVALKGARGSLPRASGA